MTRLTRGRSAFEAGDEAGGIFGVVSGCIELHIASAGGAPTLTHIGQPGLWLGDIAAIGKHRRLISAVAAADTELLRLPRACMIRIAAAEPNFWLHFAELLSANFARSFGVIGMLRRDDPVQRIAALLLNLSGDPDYLQLRVPGSQSDLAAMANLSRSTVSSALAELARRNLIRTGYGAIDIIDHNGLTTFLAMSGEV